jgi:crossover junction endodeoxyribonuclease RuvC
VLGIDPGSRYLGYGMVEQRAGKLECVTFGVVRADESASLSERLHTIFDGLKEAVGLLRPDAVAIEGVFTHKNARSALILGHARGVALLLSAQMRLPVFEYPPARVKRAVGAGGNDGKEAVARMVCLQLKLEAGTQRSDAYDALAVALCHVHSLRVPSGLRRGNALARFSERLTPSVVRA